MMAAENRHGLSQRVASFTRELAVDPKNLTSGTNLLGIHDGNTSAQAGNQSVGNFTRFSRLGRTDGLTAKDSSNPILAVLRGVHAVERMEHYVVLTGSRWGNN